ncbi:MAG TPA: IS200/IS605 family transposase [Bacteroidales bacterium]|nr:IS200/IS605 family transposase [Bacteroidales bacterium]
MSTYTQILYQIVFGTYNRTKSLKAEGRDDLYRYIAGILANKKCHLYQIGGVEDHVHIITHLHPAISLSSLVKDIKLATTEHIRNHKLFKSFDGWQEGYGGFTYSISAKDNLIEYVKNQEAHHRKISAKEEFMNLLREHDIAYNDRFPV